MTRLLPLALLALPFPAFAAPATGVATIASEGALPQKLVIDGRNWRCADGQCQGPAELRRVAVERVCKDLARKVGTVQALNVGGMALAEAQLAECNAR